MENIKPLKTYFAELLQQTELQIRDYEEKAPDILSLCKMVVDYLQGVLEKLKAFIMAYRFESPEEEIHFFKAQKPLIVSKIIYYNTVYRIELRFPSGSMEVQKEFILSETHRLSVFFHRNLSFHEYYRTDATYLDSKYFLRGKPDIQIIVCKTDPERQLNDGRCLLCYTGKFIHQKYVCTGLPSSPPVGEGGSFQPLML